MGKAMNIGLVCPYNMFRGGGVQECVLDLQRELSQQGHHVTIVTPQPRDYKAKPPINMVFVGSGAQVRYPFQTQAQVAASTDGEALEELLEQHQFDILHFHEPWVPILSRQILSRSRAVNIATFHAKLPDTVMSRTIERVITPYTRSVLKYLDGLTACSDAAAEYVRSLTDQPVRIIPNGIDLTTYQPSKVKSHKPLTITYIGRLEKRKGVEYLLQAFAILRTQQPDLRLVIAGEGPDRRKLERYVQEQHIPGVEFTGFVDKDKKLHLLAEADVFCSPAMYGESFGIVLLEAIAAGVPIVAGNNPGYSGVLTGRGILSLADTANIADFARRLELMLYDQDIRQLWLTWAATHVAQFDARRIAKQYEAFYTELVG